MNERIKELAKQAGLSYLYDYDADGHAMVCSEKDIEKFAELIVGKCMSIVDDEGCGEGGSIRAMEKIKEHFGVEE